MGSLLVSAPTAPSRPAPLDTLIANLAPIKESPAQHRAIAKPASRKSPQPRSAKRTPLQRFRPILFPIPVEPGVARIQELEWAVPREVAAPLNAALVPAGGRKCPLRPINLVGRRPKTTPRPAREMDADNLGAPATPRRAYRQEKREKTREVTREETHDSSVGAFSTKSAAVGPRKKSVKGKLLPANIKMPSPTIVFAPLMRGLIGIRRIAVPAAVAVVVALGLGSLFSRDSAILTAAEENIGPRAAFLMEDDFGGGGREGWDAPNSLVAIEAGGVRVEGLTLHTETMQLSDYRMDFEASVSSGAVSWVVRAQDSENYHLYRLEKTRKKSATPYRVVHYPVVDGKADTSQAVSNDVTQELNEQVYHRFSVRVREGRVVTFVNGESVDYWVPQERTVGGIGFFGSKAKPSMIGYVTTYSNQDFLGLSLAVALDAIKSFQEYLDQSA